MLTELGVLAALIALNGLLALSELAIVSASKVRLVLLAEQGRPGAARALDLARNPARFLSTVQVGITLVGVLAGAFSGATLGVRLGSWLQALGLRQELAEPAGVGAVVVLITYVSLVMGELVPKQLALRNAEAISCRVAPPMHLLSRIGAPLVRLLEASSGAVLRLLGSHRPADATVTEEEIRAILAEGERAGVLKAGEHDMLAGVMRLADRTARALMTPRRDVETLDLAAAPEALEEQLRRTRRTRLPVRDCAEDAIIGIINTKEALRRLACGETASLRDMVEDAPMVIDIASAGAVIEKLRTSRQHMVLVFDELGNFEGIVTALDILEAITGSFPDEEGEPDFVRREDGTWLVAGRMPVDEFFDRLGLPQVRERGYATVGGLILSELGRMPQLAERVRYGGWILEVVDLDGTRIDKVLVRKDEDD